MKNKAKHLDGRNYVGLVFNQETHHVSFYDACNITIISEILNSKVKIII